MKPYDVFNILEREVAPVALSDELCQKYGAYDNSGVILNFGQEVSGALFSLDLSPAAAERAAELGYNLVVTHHPAIYSPIKQLNCSHGSPTAALAYCAARGISVISMHLNFDAAPKGIDYYLMQGLGGDGAAALHEPLSSGGYGRVYDVCPAAFADYAPAVKKEFESDKIRFYDCNGRVKRVASFCGAGCDEGAIAFALSRGADTFASADMKHHHVAALIAAGLNVVEFTHYASEVYGFGKIYGDISEKLGVPSQFFREKIMF